MKLLTGMKPINNGAVVIDHGIIKAAGPERSIIKKYLRHRVHSFKNAVLMPGLVNAHTHLESPPLLEAIRAKTFSDWVLNLINTKRELGMRDYRAAVSHNIETLIRTGTTTVAEICSHGISRAILKQSGMRATLFQEVIAMNPATSCPRLSSLVSHPSSLIRHGISPHAPHTVSEKVLGVINQFALCKNTPLCMHVAESREEVWLLNGKEKGFDKLYQAVGWDMNWAPLAESPFAYLADLGLLGPRFLAVHAVQATNEDIAIIKKTRTPIAHCPRSNKELGVGRMPLKKLLDAGITVGLGTDSLASSPSLSMWDEMRYALRIHRPDGITARDIFRLATIGGAKALGLDKETGSLAAGKRADIIAVPLPKKNTGDLYSDLLRETKSCIINMVDGKILFKDNTL